MRMWRQWLKCDHLLCGRRAGLCQRGQVGVFLENRQPLVDLSQTRDRWVSDLAHELRTPLTSIRLVVETLQEQLQPPRQWLIAS